MILLCHAKYAANLLEIICKIYAFIADIEIFSCALVIVGVYIEYQYVFNGGLNMRIIVSFLILSFIYSFSSFAEYFYCVTTNGFTYQVIPDGKMTYKIVLAPVAAGDSIKLGHYYGEYKINQQDIAGGNFSSLLGYGKPYAYFIYPSDADDIGKMHDLVRSIVDQCQNLIKAANRPEHVFKEIRVSASLFSGLTSYFQAGYPLVYLNVPTEDNKQNIYRIRAD